MGFWSEHVDYLYDIQLIIGYLLSVKKEEVRAEAIGYRLKTIDDKLKFGSKPYLNNTRNGVKGK